VGPGSSKCTRGSVKKNAGSSNGPFIYRPQKQGVRSEPSRPCHGLLPPRGTQNKSTGVGVVGVENTTENHSPTIWDFCWFSLFILLHCLGVPQLGGFENAKPKWEGGIYVVAKILRRKKNLFTKSFFPWIFCCVLGRLSA
jgi:hypothetical protein